MFNVTVDDYSLVSNIVGFKIQDGTPNPFRFAGRNCGFMSMIREHDYDPIIRNGDGVGMFAWVMPEGVTFASHPHFWENSYRKEATRYNGRQRPRRMDYPRAFYNGTNRGDHLIAYSQIWESQYDNGEPFTYCLAQIEDVRGDAANWYVDKYSSGPGYGRTIFLRGSNPFGLQRMFHHDIGVPQSEWGLYNPECGTPVIEHWQPESVALRDALEYHPITNQPIQPQGLFGLQGTALTSQVIIGEYMYVFYTRFVDGRTQSYDPAYDGYPGYGFPPFISKIILPDGQTNFNLSNLNELWASAIQRYVGPNICVARVKVSDLGRMYWSNTANPFQKYYRERVKVGDTYTGKVDCSTDGFFYSEEPQWKETWEQPGFRGFDTSILNRNLSYAHVTWSSYLNRFIVIGQGDGFVTHLYYSKHEGQSERAILDWEFWGALPNIPPTYYPTLLNQDCTSNKAIGQTGRLWFCADVESSYKDEWHKFRPMSREIVFHK